MNPIETRPCNCPWCGAPLELDLDLTGGPRSYVEDCQVCCAPMVVTLEPGWTDADEPVFILTREGD